jgi:predicted RNA-binding protein YlqC (UPF0109 family)
MKNLLEYLLIHLVDYPEDVQIEENETERGFEYLLKVNPEDMGRVIGKRGSVAKVRAVKEGIRVFIKIED